MTKFGMAYLKQLGYSASDETEKTITSLLDGMELGNLDRLEDAIDKAVEKANKRDPKAMRVIPKDFE